MYLPFVRLRLDTNRRKVSLQTTLRVGQSAEKRLNLRQAQGALADACARGSFHIISNRFFIFSNPVWPDVRQFSAETHFWKVID